MTRDTLGRRILLALAAVVVVLSGGVGVIVGENAAATGEPVRLFGLVSLQANGVTLGAAGAALALAVLGGLFALVELASRLETEEARSAGPK